jgi:two-component system, OmpR family, alkaline phosphatase synthesis response regulator PhoP
MARILIIDDDPDMVEAAAVLLGKKGHVTFSAADGTSGYQRARDENPDLILLDVMMSYDSEGFDVARKLQEDPATRDVPIVMLTGIKKTKNLATKLAPDPDWLPVKAVLEKPVKPDELLRAVESALAG